MSQRLLEAPDRQPGSPALATPPRAPAADPRRRLTALFDRVRRRLRRRDLLLGGVAWILFTLGSSAGLMLLAALFGPAPLWRPLCGAWLIAVLFALATVIVRATRAPHDDAAIARLLGDRVPDLRSDLLSTIELGRELQHPPKLPGSTSRALVEELITRTCAQVATIDLERVLDLGPVVRSAVALALVAVVLLGNAVLLPGLLGRGLKNLLGPPPDPTTLASEPLVGDIRLQLTYPRYTGLPTRTIPGSSGEVLALPGTLVRVEARALTAVERAQLVLHAGDAPESLRPVQITVEPEGKRGAGPRPPLLVSSFTVRKAGSYHFLIDQRQRGRSERIRESDGHRVEIEADRAPRIDLFAPADDLEIAGPRRIELAYSAEDDYGLGEINLVFRVGDGPEQRKRIRSAGPAPHSPEERGERASPNERPRAPRTAAAKLEWDLAEIDLAPGVRVTYRLEARDLDDISGPNIGSSRSYSLRVTSARQKHDVMLQNQDALKEQAIQLLGDRIDLSRLEQPQKGARADAPPPEARGAATLDAHRKTEALLLAIGRMQEDVPKDPLLPKELRTALQEIGKRLGRLNQDEDAELRGRRPPADKRPARSPRGRDLQALNERHVAELERDVILLDDLLGRQRLEELLAISDELTATRDRLKQLMSEYKKSRSENLRREIEREVRELERRLQELAERAQRLQGEVPDEFVNREALGQNDLQGRLDRLRDLLQKGELDKAQAELERLSQSLDGLVKGLERDLKGYRRERFSAEDKALGEAEDKLADLMHDQEQLKGQTDDVKARGNARAKQLLRDRTEPLVRRLQDKVARLRKQVSDVETGPLGPWGSDELEKTQRRVEDVGRMLEQGDLDEARSMAQEAEQSIMRLTEELRGEEQASRFGQQRSQIAKSRGRLEQARPLARELGEEIGRALPRNEELLTPEDRKTLQELRARQEAVRKQAEGLSREVQKRARDTKDAPLLDRLSQEMGESLGKAKEHMERAEGQLKQLSPRGAASAEQQALEQMASLRKQMQQARRPKDSGGGAQLREPVRIPGAEEYKAPKEFRQDILEAAKREAPTEYRDQVKRYYEELIK